MKTRHYLLSCSIACMVLGLVYERGRAQPPAPPSPLAQEARTRLEQPVKREEMIARTKAMFAKLDVNHQSYLTKEGAQAAMKSMWEEKRTKRLNARFESMDSNHDGSISREEFMAAMAHHEQHMPPPPPPPEAGREPMEHHGGWAMARRMMMRHMGGGMMLTHMFDKADANHDGKLTLDELLAFRLAQFDAADTNHDGVVTPEERHAYFMAKMHEAHKNWRGGSGRDWHHGDAPPAAR
jgi:EF-hand domain pair/EF hand